MTADRAPSDSHSDSSPSPAAWTALTARLLEITDLDGAIGLLDWDEQVWMPAAGDGYRGRQKALLARLRHERLADPQVGDWLHQLADDATAMLDPVRAAAVRNLSRDHARATKIPSSLVEAKALATSSCFAAWREARKEDQTRDWLPELDHMLGLARQEARCLATDGLPYDALVEQYDPGIDTGVLQALFLPLARGTRALLDELQARPAIAPAPLAVPVEAQKRIHRRVASALGFDLERGRLDEAAHPFTMGIGPQDVRLTTRYFAHDLLAGLLGTVHEAGHGMYEQGLPEALRGTTVEAAASTGLHESQSRFWENIIGRSRPFLSWLAGVIQDEAGIQVDLDALHRGANRVAPSHIRVEADEVTYNLHIALRFQLESALLNDDLSTADLPGAWDDLAEQLLGIRPSRPSQGVLQDVHWSAGLIGYFPSYTLGNLYAAALTEKIEAALPGMWDDVARGQMGDILGWLRSNVHSRGHHLDGHEVIAELTDGRDLVAALLAHFRRRHGGLYGL